MKVDKQNLIYFHFQAISRQLADTVERSKLAVGKLEGSSTIVDEVAAIYITRALALLF